MWCCSVVGMCGRGVRLPGMRWTLRVCRGRRVFSPLRRLQSSPMTIDVWMQHPTQRFLGSEMLASLRRWTGGSMPDTDIPIDATIQARDEADVHFGLLSAWLGPNGQDLVSNDEVAEWVQLNPTRFAGLAT